jgi:hypothetical protein
MQIPNFTIGDHNREAFCLLVKALPTGQLYTGRVIEKKSARSLDQNSLYWELVTGLGNQIGYEKDEMHYLLGFKFLSYEKNGETFIKSTTKLNTAEFSEYFAKCERFAAECGFILDTVRF